MIFRKPYNVVNIRAANPVCRRTIERSKILNPEYSIDRDQPTPVASPLRIIDCYTANASVFRQEQSQDCLFATGEYWVGRCRIQVEHVVILSCFNCQPTMLPRRREGVGRISTSTLLKRNTDDSLPPERFCLNQLGSNSTMIYRHRNALNYQ